MDINMWLSEVNEKLRRKNQILFSRDSILLANLAQQLQKAPRRAVAQWALTLAEESAAELLALYPDDPRPMEAVAAAKSWAAGEIKMPLAKPAILRCHAMAKELESPADIALCHAVGQACSVLHTVRHAIGYPMYELTAIIRQEGIDHCRDAVEARVRRYEQLLAYYMEQE